MSNREIDPESPYPQREERPTALGFLLANPWLGDNVSGVIDLGVAALVKAQESGVDSESIQELDSLVLGLLAKKYFGEEGVYPDWYQERPEESEAGPPQVTESAPLGREPFSLREAVLPGAIVVGGLAWLWITGKRQR